MFGRDAGHRLFAFSRHSTSATDGRGICTLAQSGLAGLRTQHLCFNHLVSSEGERAHCQCDFIIHRWQEQADDTRFLHTYDYYRYGFLKATDECWLIDSIEQYPIRTDGSLELHGAHRSVVNMHAAKIQ